MAVGMVGGGRNAFIGAVHRLAMRLGDQITLVAGRIVLGPQNACWCYFTAVTLPAASRRQPTRARRTSMPPCLA
ncbi:hypothetical protein [Mesorhizobium sp. M6A.T.Ce.TU.016.01.1.1]|uniref:hypothetical protein n=1 Tax=Mesorhizobium sp. M6A.T.Ce.TU.016.01.1.1 TaxID=2496783 RepID=UPI001FE1F8ED|nr:hypothetical protein [Mesorhizobium sp. M6A.T.Ce.TU.016.01.1.1]